MSDDQTKNPDRQRGVSVLIVLAATATAIATVYLVATMNIHVPRLIDPVGPRAFPILIGLGMLAAAILMLVEHFQNKSLPATPAAISDAEDEGQDDPKFSWIVGGIFAWTMLYIIAFEPVGYVVATAIYLCGLMFYFNRGKPIVNVLVSVLFCGVSYYVLSVLLKAQLPPGELFRGFFS